MLLKEEFDVLRNIQIKHLAQLRSDLNLLLLFPVSNPNLDQCLARSNWKSHPNDWRIAELFANAPEEQVFPKFVDVLIVVIEQ